jgi:hypothetical protein
LNPKYWRIKPVRPSDKHFGLSLMPESDDQKNPQAAQFSGDIELYYAKTI